MGDSEGQQGVGAGAGRRPCAAALGQRRHRDLSGGRRGCIEAFISGPSFGRDHTTHTVHVPGLVLTEHEVTVPLDHAAPPGPDRETNDEESSGIIPAPFLGAGKYLFDDQNHTKVADPAIVEKGQLLVVSVPPGQPVSKRG